MSSRWVNDSNAAMLTDLYQLTMLQSYFDRGMSGIAVFDLFVRRLSPARNYLIACGLDDVLHYLGTFSFSADDLAYLKSLNRFTSDFIEYLARLRFTGDVFAVPEGTAIFANEPLVEIIAPLPEAQIVETFLVNQIHMQSLAASKAARVVAAAGGRQVIDYGLRRIHGADAGLKMARAFYIAGVHGTSNVLAGKTYGIPVSGTMAHSFVQAHQSEYDAFRHFTRAFPEGTLLVDTYDTIEGVRQVIQLAHELGPEFRVTGVRLDSGDLAALAKQTRRMLDDAGLARVKIYASSSIDEYVILDLLHSGAPIDGFGVGTHMGTSADIPYLDAAYKLVEYDGVPRMKLSASKLSLPGRKQIFRQYINGLATKDVVAAQGETLEGQALLEPVMSGGQRTSKVRSLEEARSYCRENIRQLPSSLLGLKPADPCYPVHVSPALTALEAECKARLL